VRRRERVGGIRQESRLNGSIRGFRIGFRQIPPVAVRASAPALGMIEARRESTYAGGVHPLRRRVW